MAAPEFPVTTGRLLAIFCFFSDEPQRVSNCHVVIEHEKGELVAQRALKDLTFAPDSPISRNIVSFNGLVWPYPGGYLVRFVAGRDEVLAHFPLWVRHLPASSEPEP
jgi:hypothetical protein